MDREGLVGATVGVGGPQWQHLPDLQAGRGDEVDKTPGIGAKVAAVTGPGQAGGVQQDAAAALARQGGVHEGFSLWWRITPPRLGWPPPREITSER